MLSREERKEVAETIIAQMGGTGKLKAMIGAKNFRILESGLWFEFKGSRKANVCEVVYNYGSNTYNFKLQKYSPKYCTFTDVYYLEGCYSDMLIELFESKTGLQLSL